MAKRKNTGDSGQNKANKLEMNGVVIENLQDTKYLVEIELEGLKHKLTAYPSGKLRTYYRGRIMVGDEVTVEIDPPYIDIGRITRKLQKKDFINTEKK